MTDTIAFANQKGGVGKTTTTQNVGAAASEAGVRTLLVDLDPQASLTTACGVKVARDQQTLYTLMTAYGRAESDEEFPDVASAIVEVASNLDLLPITLDAADADLELQNVESREHLLGDLLAAVRDRYDLILLDCPPHLGLLTLNALTAATHVVVPVTPEFLAAQGLERLMKTIRRVQRRLNPSLQVSGIILTQVKGRTNEHRTTGDELASRASDTPILGSIPDTIATAEAPAYQRPVVWYSKQDRASLAYRALTTTLLTALEVSHAPVE